MVQCILDPWVISCAFKVGLRSGFLILSFGLKKINHPGWIIFWSSSSPKTFVNVLPSKNFKLCSSKSSVQSTAAVQMGQNGSAHVARSLAAIWRLFLFKWSQLWYYIKVPFSLLLWCISSQRQRAISCAFKVALKFDFFR